MPWYIKTERFTEKTINLSKQERHLFIRKHQQWVLKLRSSNINISSGYLVDSKGDPGSGGLLILEAESYDLAMRIIKEDPMIANELVIWHLNEWIPFCGEVPSELYLG